MKKMVVMVVMLFMMTGCSSAYLSQGMQCSIARAGTDVAVTVVLDNVAAENVANTKNEIITWCSTMSKFVNTGVVDNTTFEALQNTIISKTPLKYQEFAKALMTEAFNRLTSGTSITTGANLFVNAKVKRLLAEVFSQAAVAANKYFRDADDPYFAPKK